MLGEDNLLVIAVDNAANNLVYPQVADFTFYGGLYRDVNMICVKESHFDLDYFGWYGGETSMNGPRFDKFHAKYPNLLVGCSEYGCEALNWHTSDPKQGDYTEEYQAYYHEELIKQLFTRKYLWATH